MVDLLAAAAGPCPTLLLVDDVHLADPVTVECLAFLVAGIGSLWRGEKGDGLAPPSLAASYRAESPFRGVVGPLREALGRSGQGHLVLDLPPLSAEEVEGWVRRTLGGTARERAVLKAAPVPGSLHRACGQAPSSAGPHRPGSCERPSSSSRSPPFPS